MGKHNLLVIHHGALGDVVATFPALLKLKKNAGRFPILSESLDHSGQGASGPAPVL
jgi:hypothetical protein